MNDSVFTTPEEVLAKVIEALRPATSDDAVSLAVLEVLFSQGSPIIGITDLAVTTETPVQLSPDTGSPTLRYEHSGAFRTTIEIAGIYRKMRL